MRSPIPIVLAVALVLIPAVAGALNLDLRIKGGRTPGLDSMTVEPIIDASGSGETNNDLQAEAVIAPLRGRFSPIFTIGGFSRTHSGAVSDVFRGVNATRVDYDASGLVLGAGVRFKVSPHFNLEGKIELGLGSGNATLSTPGFIWNHTREREYVSTSLIIGGYFIAGKPGPQLGLEVGLQDFSGDFQIWNNGGYWSDGNVMGGGALIKMVVGMRF